MRLKVWHMTQNVPHFCRLWVWGFYDFPTGILTGIFVVCANKLTLPFKTGCKTLSVTCGDSSPKGRAKASCNRINGHGKWSVSISIRSINCFTNTTLMSGGFSVLSKPDGKQVDYSAPARAASTAPMIASEEWVAPVTASTPTVPLAAMIFSIIGCSAEPKMAGVSF